MIAFLIYTFKIEQLQKYLNESISCMPDNYPAMSK